MRETERDRDRERHTDRESHTDSGVYIQHASMCAVKTLVYDSAELTSFDESLLPKRYSTFKGDG